jgi:hypothetical protein
MNKEEGVRAEVESKPVEPEGVRGWGAKGELDLGRISKLAAMPK